MITLHGFAYSNYYNIAKHVLLYKGIDFKENLVYPGSPDYSHINPAGKVPTLTTADGKHIGEASVICEYLEESHPDPALLPADPYQRSHIRQIMRSSELYLELPYRRLLPFVFSKTPAPQALQDEINATADRGVASLNALCSINPFLGGTTLTLADIYLRYVLAVVEIGASLCNRDVVAEVDGLRDWQAMLAEDPISKRIDADRDANRDSFFAYVASRL